MPKLLENDEDTTKPRRKARGTSDANRVHVSYPPSMKKRLDEIKRETDSVSLSEVFRQALMFYALAFEEHKKGSDILIRNKNGELERLRMFM